MKTFYDIWESIDQKEIKKRILQTSRAEVVTVLEKTHLSWEDFLVLISPAAQDFLDPMAERAQELTLKHFGKNILLYVPLYLSNVCENLCLYCGFSAAHKSHRTTLTGQEFQEELKAIKGLGFKNLLLLTGESRRAVSVDDLALAVQRASKENFFVSLEVYPLQTHEFETLVDAGAVGLTVYQETYDGEIYDKVHPRGAKKDFRFRLETPDRALSAGFRKVGIGALLGLGDWLTDGALVGAHAQYLMKTYWRSEISVSFPRLRQSGIGYESSSPVNDRQLVQLILALRLFLPMVTLTISTRESADFRNHIMGLGVTMMSAGSKTSPGGYRENAPAEEKQFEILDDRTVEQVCETIKKQGFYPVFKDWSSVMTGVAHEHYR